MGRWLWITALVGALGAAGCKAPTERTVTYDDRYGATKMDLYLPSGDRARPAVLLAHGGGWKYFHKEQYRSVGRRLARSGYVAASLEYRLVPNGRFPNAVRDTGCALAYLQNHADELGLDPSRIVVMGYSAGAHLLSLVAVAGDHPELASDCAEGVPGPPAGVISGAGPMDMGGLREAPPVRDFLGGSESRIPEIYELASPITHVTPDDPPFLFVHGKQDFFVPVEQAERMRDALRAEGVEADLLRLRGTGHVFNPTSDGAAIGIATSFDAPEAWLAITDFLDRTVGRP